MATAIQYGLTASLTAVAIITVVGTLNGSNETADAKSLEQAQMLGNQSRFHGNFSTCTTPSPLNQQDQVAMFDGQKATVTVKDVKCDPTHNDYAVLLTVARPGNATRPAVWVNARR